MKVLYINPGTKHYSNRYCQVGLGYLASITKKLGHQVIVYDKPFLNSININLSFKDVIKKYKPNLIGISLSTYSYPQAKKIIKYINKIKIPIIVGGPHISTNPECINEIKVNYILKNEVDISLPNVLKEIAISKKQKLPQQKIVPPILPTNLDKQLVFPSYKEFIGFEKATAYSISTSRGCPMGCSFCAVKLVSSKAWRQRSAHNCLSELKLNLPLHKNITEVAIVDDSPNINKARFKDIVKKFIINFHQKNLTIFHLRADFIDKEMVSLLKNANCDYLHIGVEHGDPKVFKMVSKKETLKDIVKACKIIKESGLKLGLCFIIGLPGDTYQKTMTSINFAKMVKADSVYWNIAQPFPGTQMFDWFTKHGRFFKIPNYLMSFDRSFIPKISIVESDNFKQYDRQRAYFTAVIETNQISTDGRIKDYLNLFYYSIRYHYFLRTTFLLFTNKLNLKN